MKFITTSILYSFLLTFLVVTKLSAEDFNPSNFEGVFKLQVEEANYSSCMTRIAKTFGCKNGGCAGVGPMMMAVCRCEFATNASEAKRLCGGIPKEKEMGGLLKQSVDSAKKYNAKTDPLITRDLRMYAYHSVWSGDSKGNVRAPGVLGPLPAIEVPPSVKDTLKAFTPETLMKKCMTIRAESPGDPLLRSDRSSCLAVGAMYFENVSFCNKLPEDTSISQYKARNVQPALNLIILCKTVLAAKTGDTTLCDSNSYCIEQSKNIRKFKNLSSAVENQVR